MPIGVSSTEEPILIFQAAAVDFTARQDLRAYTGWNTKMSDNRYSVSYKELIVSLLYISATISTYPSSLWRTSLHLVAA